MTQNTTETIELLKRVIRDENCQRMNKSNIKGYLGELFVKQKLVSEGGIVYHKGNQSGYDLFVESNIKIDVKSSTVKGTKDFPDWGWALRIKTQEKVKFTHLVCVGFDMEFNAEKYCIINVKDLESFPSISGRFNSVKRSFSLMLDGVNFPDNEYFNKCKQLIEEGRVMVINKDGNLMEKLVS